MMGTTYSDMFISFIYGLYVFLVGLGHTWRDARAQIGGTW